MPGKKKNKSSSGKKVASELVSHPSPFQANLRFKHMFRFQAQGSAGGSVSGAVTRAILLNLVMAGTSSTTAYRALYSIKVNRVEMFGGPLVNTSTVSLQWISNLGPNSQVSDSSTSSAYPPHLITTPPPSSLASFWSTNGSNESELLFDWGAPSFSYIDIHCELILNDNPTPTTTTGYSSVPSSIFYGYLGPPGSSGYPLPVSQGSSGY